MGLCKSCIISNEYDSSEDYNYIDKNGYKIKYEKRRGPFYTVDYLSYQKSIVYDSYDSYEPYITLDK